MPKVGPRLLPPILVALTACQETPSSDGDIARPAMVAEAAAKSLEVPQTPERRAAELARMQKYIDDLYSRQDVVHAFRSSNGDDVDCLKIEKQPTLRGTGISPRDIPRAPRNAPPQPPTVSSNGFGQGRPAGVFTDGSQDSEGRVRACPPETIPIRRLTMETLSRFPSVEAFRGKGMTAPVKPPSATAHEHATIGNKVVNNHGAESTINLWRQFVYPQGEFSLSQIWVHRGGGSNLETVEVGVQHYKDLYGNDEPRLFIYFTPDNYGSGGCYNLSCSGFTQTNNSVVIGGSFTNYSVLNGDQWEMKVMLFKDNLEGSWWLRYYDTWVGFWHRDKFDGNGLRDLAAVVDFGAEIVNTAVPGVSAHTATDMGSGRFPAEGWQKAAYQRNIAYIDTGNSYQDIGTTTLHRPRPECYDISVALDPGGWGRYIFVGGPGYRWPDCL